MDKRRVLWYLVVINLVTLFIGVPLLLFFVDSVLILSVQETVRFLLIAFPVALVLSIIHFISHSFFSLPAFNEDEDVDTERKFLSLLKLPYNASYHVLLNLLIISFIFIVLAVIYFALNISLAV